MAEIANIQWFPGHMTKTKRMISANLSMVDAVVEILDARIPDSSRNPELNRLLGKKPRMLVLNKADMADPNATASWISYYQAQGMAAIAVECKSGKGLKQVLPALRTLLSELLARRSAKGMANRPIRVMIVGIPNVGKSTFINRMAGTKRAKAEDRPGVTRTKQWIKLADGLEMLDMPGVLWPKFDDQEAAYRLAFTGAIKDDILDVEALAMLLLETLAKQHPKALQDRYQITAEPEEAGKSLLERVGARRGMLLSGGVVNTERAAITVLDEFRGAKLGRITLERPFREDRLS